MQNKNFYLVLGIFLMVGILVNGVAASYTASVYVPKPLDVYRGTAVKFTAYPEQYDSYPNCKIVFEITRVIGVYKFSSIGSVPCDSGRLNWKANKLPGLYRVRARLKNNGKWVSDYSDYEEFRITWTPKCTLKIEVRENDGSSTNFEYLTTGLSSKIYVDGKYAGGTNYLVKQVSAGTHTIEARRRDYETGSQQVTCREWETRDVQLALVKKGAKI